MGAAPSPFDIIIQCNQSGQKCVGYQTFLNFIFREKYPHTSTKYEHTGMDATGCDIVTPTPSPNLVGPIQINMGSSLIFFVLLFIQFKNIVSPF